MDPQSLVGKQVDGYYVREQIASGGMADVYLAHEVSLKRDVVLKVLLFELSRNDELSLRFRREAQATARLDHPNIVQIYSTGIAADNRPYLAMQYIEGKSLQDRLLQLGKQEQLLSTRASLYIVRQIADALDTAHRYGIIHRDLKPSNILLHTDGRPILADLGIAVVRSDTRLTQTGTILGTPHYMSPEQASGSDVDSRSDIYSLGIVLYELLTGRVPFDADSSLAILHQHVYSNPQPIESLRPDLTSATRKILDHCMAKDPGQRFQSAATLVKAVDQALVVEGTDLHMLHSLGPAIWEDLHRKTELVGQSEKPLYRRVPDWVLILGVLALIAAVFFILQGGISDTPDSSSLTLGAEIDDSMKADTIPTEIPSIVTRPTLESIVLPMTPEPRSTVPAAAIPRPDTITPKSTHTRRPTATASPSSTPTSSAESILIRPYCDMFDNSPIFVEHDQPVTLIWSWIATQPNLVQDHIDASRYRIFLDDKQVTAQRMSNIESGEKSSSSISEFKLLPICWIRPS